VKGIVILYMLVCLGAINAQEGWYIISTEQGTTTTYTGIQFFYGLTGFSTASYGNAHNNGGFTLKTTNGGLNWFSVEFGVARRGMYFLNVHTGWTVGGYWDDAGKLSREVFRTTNSGMNFTRLYIDSASSGFSDVFFADSNTGWILTYNRLLKTTCSGVSWFECTPLNLISIYFINSNTGWAISQAAVVYKSTNGGVNWLSQFSASGISFSDIHFLGENTGWICGSSSRIYKTTNSGINWSPYNTGVTAGLSSIEFYNNSKGWACGDSGKIIYSTNGGINWTRQLTGVSHSLSLMSFPTENTGYVIGVLFTTPYSHENILLKTTTGGLIPVENVSFEIPDKFTLRQNYPNPFNPVTKIKFEIPPTPLSSIGEGPGVRLIVYDVLGREVVVLVNEQLKPGTYEGEFDGTNYPSGVYFYKLITADNTETKSMVLLK